MNDKPDAHLGSAVIMMRYEAPELIGQKRAAFITEGPFIIADGPHAGEWGADITWLVNEIGTSDQENADPVFVDGVPSATMAVYTGMDRRKNVPYDPAGSPRSWHVWGEAEGEG